MRRKNITMPENVVPNDPLEEFISKMATNPSLLIFRFLAKENSEATEDTLSEKLGMSKNLVRKLLYKLHDINVVVYRRVRDEKTNYYIYYWKINWEGLAATLLERKKEVLKKLKEKAASEEGKVGIYYCKKCGREYTFDEALENDFRCKICNEPLEFTQKGKYEEFLQKYIKKLEEEIKIESERNYGS
ncbi:transcription factor [Fervidicoccus sp.]|uniref:transcription factor n=1 Tax=Fervidicoccus sp. TaxID=2060324 RepID=UPI003D0C482B